MRIINFFRIIRLRHILRRTEKAIACQKATNAELRKILAEMQQS
jgi:hypothetical protein